MKRKKLSEGGEPLVIKSIMVDAVPMIGEKELVAVITLTDADDGEAEYVVSAEGARKMIAAMEAYLNALKRY
jgi:hypothetical protein